jgi:predicted enzyme related to lactoylglutathione lyase
MLKIKASAAALPAQDIARARKFYEQKLGLAPSEVGPDGGAWYKTGETMFFVFPSQGKASGDHTQIGLEVDDIVATVTELKGQGVTLEEYDSPQVKTKDGIVDMGESRGCWFKDTEGNLIAVMQRVPAAQSSTSPGGATTSR